MGKAKKTGVHGLGGKVDRPKGQQRHKATKNEGVYGFARAQGDNGKSLIKAVKAKSKPVSHQKRGSMAELMSKAKQKEAIKEEKAADGGDPSYQLDKDESDDENDPQMEEDEVEADQEEELDEEGLFVKKGAAKDSTEVEREIRSSGASMSLRERGLKNLEKMADRTFAVPGTHMKDAEDDDIKGAIDLQDDKYGYFAAIPDEKGTLEVPFTEEGLSGHTFDDELGTGTYTKVEKEKIRVDESGHRPTPMAGGWDDTAFPAHPLEDLYARKFAPPTSKSRGGKTIEQADAEAEEKKRQDSAIILKYQRKKRLNVDRVEPNIQDMIEEDDKGGTEESLLACPDAEYDPALH